MSNQPSSFEDVIHRQPIHSKMCDPCWGIDRFQSFLKMKYSSMLFPPVPLILTMQSSECSTEPIMIVDYRSCSFHWDLHNFQRSCCSENAAPYAVKYIFDRISKTSLSYIMIYSMDIEWDVGVFNHFLPLYPILFMPVIKWEKRFDYTSSVWECYLYDDVTNIQDWWIIKFKTTANK